MTKYLTNPTEPPAALLSRVEQRVRGRQLASDLATLIPDADLACPHFMESLIDTLRKLGNLDPPKPQLASTPVESIKRLGATLMPFGQHKDKTFDEIDLHYLDWLCRNQEEVLSRLRAYLKHPDLDSRRRGVDG